MCHSSRSRRGASAAARRTARDGAALIGSFAAQRAAGLARQPVEHVVVAARIGQFAVGAADERPLARGAQALRAATGFRVDAEQAGLIGGKLAE